MKVCKTKFKKKKKNPIFLNGYLTSIKVSLLRVCLEWCKGRMRCCFAVISGALAPAISPYPRSRSRGRSRSRSRSIVKLTNNSLFQSQRHSHVYSVSLTLRNRFINNDNCHVSAQCSRAEAEELSDDDFVVVNFYRFVFIKNPEAEVARHLSFLQVSSQIPQLFFFFENSLAYLVSSTYLQFLPVTEYVFRVLVDSTNF